ncbi:Arm DNA-binding domain-containing protein [Capnocytophaga gingivalis]
MKQNRKSTFKVLFYLKKNAPKKNGKVAIMCRITIDGKQAQFSTKLEVPPDKWDLKYGRMSGKAQEALKAKDFINDFDLLPSGGSRNYPQYSVDIYATT